MTTKKIPQPNESGNGPRYPSVCVKLTGRDGNVFVLAGGVARGLKDAGVEKAEVDKFYADLNACEDYGAALRHMMAWVDVR